MLRIQHPIWRRELANESGWSEHDALGAPVRLREFFFFFWRGGRGLRDGTFFLSAEKEVLIFFFFFLHRIFRFFEFGRAPSYKEGVPWVGAKLGLL